MPAHFFQSTGIQKSQVNARKRFWFLNRWILVSFSISRFFFFSATPGFGDRVFYETLLRQRPDSAMAQEWYARSAFVLPLSPYSMVRPANRMVTSLSRQSCVSFLSDLPSTNSFLPPFLFAVLRCVNYGVLPHKKAAKLFAIVADRKKKQRLGGMSSASSGAPKKKKAKIVKEEAVDTELQLPGSEGVASANL